MQSMSITEINAQPLLSLLDTAARQLATRQPRKLVKKAYASSGYTCALQQYYGRTGHPVTNDTYVPDYHIDAELGNTMHEMYQSWLVETGKVVMLPAWDKTKANQEGLQPAIEVPLDERTLTPDSYARFQALEFGARPDALTYLLTTRPDGTPQVAYFEIKTVELKDLVGDGVKYLGEKLSHYAWQVQAIIDTAEFKTIGKLDGGIVLVISRSKNPTTGARASKLYYVGPDPDFRSGEMQRIADLAAMVNARTPPPPEPHRGLCSFRKKGGGGRFTKACQWWDVCPAGENEKTPN